MVPLGKKPRQKKIRMLPIIEKTRWIFEPRGDSPFVFWKGKGGRPYTNNRLNKVWKKASKLSGIEKISLRNAVRHSFACQRLNQGYSIEEVRVVLGHSTSKMTQRYAQYTLQSLEDIITGNRPVMKTEDVKLLEDKGKDKKKTRVLASPF